VDNTVGAVNIAVAQTTTHTN